MKQSNVIIVVSMACWGVCSVVYSFQLLDLDLGGNCASNSTDCSRWFSIIAFMCLFFVQLFVAPAAFVCNYKEGKSNFSPNTITRFLGLEVLWNVFCFFIVYSRPQFNVVLIAVHLLVVVTQGHLFLSLLKHYNFCYLLFLYFVGEGVCTCSMVNVAQHPLSRMCIYSFSLVLVFLCALHFYIRGKEVAHVDQALPLLA